MKTLLGLRPTWSTRYVEHYFTWIQSGAFNVGFDFAVDRLTAVMLLVVTGIGSLIHIYAVGYMAHEGGYYRFFAYLNLFMFFMLMLVLAANFLLLFVGWEGVGLCSYLLIGFYFLKKSAADAGKKAFIVNRIGDFGFSLAMFLIFITLRLARLRRRSSPRPQAHAGGDSARHPHRHLPAAAGRRHRQVARRFRCTSGCRTPWKAPRPVSALIHAATMVTAGVYMVRPLAPPSSLHAPIALDVGRHRRPGHRRSSPPPSAWRRTTSRRSSPTPPSRSSATCSWASAWARSPPASSTSMTHAFFKACSSSAPAASSTPGRRAGHAQHGRPAQEDPRSPSRPLICAARRHRRHSALLRLLQQGRDPLAAYAPRALDVLGRRGHRRHDRLLRLPRHLPDLLRRVPRPRAIRTNRPLVMTGAAGGSGRCSRSAAATFNVPHCLEPVLPARAQRRHDMTLVVRSRSPPAWPASPSPGSSTSSSPACPTRSPAVFGGLYRLVYNKYFVDEALRRRDRPAHRSTARARVLWKGVDAA